METHEQKRLVDAYIRRYSRYDPAIGRHEVRSFWVWQACDWLCVNDPDGLWELVLEILAHTRNDRVLGALAAGELEDLIEYHGGAFIERIEQRAASDPRFRRLLCGVWRSSTPEVWARILAASDGNFNDVPQRAMWICYDRHVNAEPDEPVAGPAAQAVPEGEAVGGARKVPARIVPPAFQRSPDARAAPDTAAQARTAAPVRRPARAAAPDP
ncbi:DUF6869 domain-containing protein [Cupriavidus sp. 30B13]|uniref:DUF6869 domain-containing protein n=1 Tax=Cupriavidus sp. 30B13 TaxID=3384241 RepID=UPI003B9009A0